MFVFDIESIVIISKILKINLSTTVRPLRNQAAPHCM
jgi:hypothetical protein